MCRSRFLLYRPEVSRQSNMAIIHKFRKIYKNSTKKWHNFFCFWRPTGKITTSRAPHLYFILINRFSVVCHLNRIASVICSAFFRQKVVKPDKHAQWRLIILCKYEITLFTFIHNMSFIQRRSISYYIQKLNSGNELFLILFYIHTKLTFLEKVILYKR